MKTLKLWIARDRHKELKIFTKKPVYSKDDFFFCVGAGDNNNLTLPSSCFPEITFENSPQQVELISSEEYKRLKDIEEDWIKHIGYGPNAYD